MDCPHGLRDAARVILAEAAGHDDVHTYARFVHGEYAFGREVPSGTFLSLIKQASSAGVLEQVRDRRNQPLDNAVVTLRREVDRRVPARG